MNWIQKLFHRSKAEAVPKSPESLPANRSDMTLERWHKSDTLVTWARSSPEFAHVLAVVFNQQPRGFPMRGQVVTETQCSVELGRMEGYSDCENLLFALRNYPAKPTKEIEADYDDTNYDEKIRLDQET